MIEAHFENYKGKFLTQCRVQQKDNPNVTSTVWIDAKNAKLGLHYKEKGKETWWIINKLYSTYPAEQIANLRDSQREFKSKLKK